jgi:protein-S-isoprenylcysteine O-methyltransferase Ste14
VKSAGGQTDESEGDTVAGEPEGTRDPVGSSPQAANLGLLRPPLVYLGSIALGLGLHWVRPVRLLPPSLGTPIGAVLVVAGGALFVSAVRAFRAAGTSVPGNRPTTVIVRSGPYRVTRNPIYLAFTLVQLGLASWVDSLWLGVTLLPAVGLMGGVVIPREERYLEARFPSEYAAYKASVRRWL